MFSTSLTNSTTIQAHKATEALAAYHATRSKIKIRAADRAFYEAQLEKMAEREKNGFVVTDPMLAGLFLLCALSIQTSSTGGFFLRVLRNGLAAIFDAGFDDDETGSHLESALGRFKFIVPGETEPVAISRLALACTTPYSPDNLVAFSSASMQEIFLSMAHETIYVNGRAATFFSAPEKQLVYRHSYLCAMRDIYARAIEEKIFPELSVKENIGNKLFKVIENAMTHLSELSSSISVVFPELADEQYALLRTKSVCFLVLSRIYFALKSTHNVPVELFLERLLKEFFSQKIFSNNSRAQAYCLSSQFFNKNSVVLLENVSPDASALLLDVQKPATSLLAWAQQYDFNITLQDKYLVENFLANHMPITGDDITRDNSIPSLEL